MVTGSGRCGTRYLADLLTAAGVPCGHELVWNERGVPAWPKRLVADSSWMAATQLGRIDLPVVLLVRHPLAVVRSWVEIGFFTVDESNPTHGPLRAFAPRAYEYERPHDRALAMWLALNQAVLPYAELVLRLERLDAAQLGRLLRWCGGDPGHAEVFAEVPRANRHQEMRDLTGVLHVPSWDAHDRALVAPAQALARLLGYDPWEAPGD